MTTKKCIKCGMEKDFSKFTKNKTCTNGIEGVCKKCNNKRKNKWKSNNKDKIYGKYKELYHKDIGKSGKTAILKRYRVLFEINPIREKAKRAKGSMVVANKKNNIQFNKEYFTIDRLESMFRASKRCPCCGTEFIYHWGTNRKPEPRSPSFDRFIPQLGYVKGNVFLICWRCNNLKRDATAEELFKIAEWMVKTRSAIQIKEYK